MVKIVKKRRKPIRVEHEIKENKTLYKWVFAVIVVICLMVLWQIFRIGVMPGEAIKSPEPMQDCCCDCIDSREVIKLGFFGSCLEACEHACAGKVVAVNSCTPAEASLFLKFG